MDKVSHQQFRKPKPPRQQGWFDQKQYKPTPHDRKIFTRCGRSPHGKEVCPARNARCRKCSKIGHFAAVCRSLAVQAVEEEEEDETYLGMVVEEEDEMCGVGSVTTNPWRVTLEMEGIKEQFKLDTGADVTVIPESMVPKNKRPLQRAGKKLFSPDIQK